MLGNGLIESVLLKKRITVRNPDRAHYFRYTGCYERLFSRRYPDLDQCVISFTASHYFARQSHMRCIKRENSFLAALRRRHSRSLLFREITFRCAFAVLNAQFARSFSTSAEVTDMIYDGSFLRKKSIYYDSVNKCLSNTFR